MDGEKHQLLVSIQTPIPSYLRFCEIFRLMFLAVFIELRRSFLHSQRKAVAMRVCDAIYLCFALVIYDTML